RDHVCTDKVLFFIGSLCSLRSGAQHGPRSSSGRLSRASKQALPRSKA
ncbi:hypothetical protein L917_21247, partial [Phytophthora nicotianae]